MEPSLSSELDTVAEARADVAHDAPGRVGDPLADLGDVVGPAEVGEAGDEGRAGQVVEEEVERGAAGDLVRAAPRRWPSAGCRRRGSPTRRSRPGAAGRPQCAGCRGRGRSPRRGPRLPTTRLAARRRQQVTCPPLRGGGRCPGRRARTSAWSRCAGPSRAGVAGVRRRDPTGGGQRRHAGAPSSQIMFSWYAAPVRRRTFRTTLLAKAQVKSVRSQAGPVGSADDDADGHPRRAASGRRLERQAGGEGGGPASSKT